MSDQIIDSVLEVKAVAGLNVTHDLTLQDGKSIADLLDDQEKAENKPTSESGDGAGISTSS